jgi:hypothetical protein
MISASAEPTGAELIARDLAANGPLHQVADARGLLDAGSGLGAQMQFELAGIRGREEILAQPGVQQETGKTNDQEERHKDQAAVHQYGQDGLVTVAEIIESVLEGPLEQHQRVAAGPVVLMLQQVFRQRGDQRSREPV